MDRTRTLTGHLSIEVEYSLGNSLLFKSDLLQFAAEPIPNGKDMDCESEGRFDLTLLLLLFPYNIKEMRHFFERSIKDLIEKEKLERYGFKREGNDAVGP